MRFLVFLLVLLTTARASAHTMRAAYVDIVEETPGRATLVLKLPVSSRDAWPEIEGCVGSLASESTYVARLSLVCARPLEGATLTVRGLGPTVPEAVVRVRLADGRSASQVLGPRSPNWTIPARSELVPVLGRYVVVGVEHILTGFDHLLFLLGLFLAIDTRRGLVLAATSFTLAHALTSTLTALRVLTVPSAWAEACIAASLVLVALDADPREKRRNDHGAPLAFVFGLVHGLGFAGALSEIGLPADARFPALLGFNLGVDLGQVMFLGALVLGAQLVSKVRSLAAHAVGSIGFAVFIARVVELFGGR